MGAKKIKCGAQHNQYFDRHGTLKSKRMILRLRKDNSGSYLTLKGPRLPAKFTKRIEHETPVDYLQTKSILTALGFSPFRTYTKRREEYRLHHCLVALDHIPGHGWYVEIEGREQNIQKLSDKLGLKTTDREERSYLAILFPKLIPVSPQKKLSKKPNHRETSG